MGYRDRRAGSGQSSLYAGEKQPERRMGRDTEARWHGDQTVKRQLCQQEGDDNTHAQSEEPQGWGRGPDRAAAAQFPGNHSRVEHLFVGIGSFKYVKQTTGTS